MALKNIPQGSEVISSDLNDNFEYLDGRITTVGSSITTLQSNIQSLNSTLSSQIEQVQTDMENSAVSKDENNTISGNNTFSGTNSFTGDVTVTTQAYGTNNTRIATTAFAKSARNINYSSGVTVTAPYSGNKYTAPYDGVYIGSTFLNQNFSNLFINNVSTKIITHDSADGASYSNIFVPLKQGDVIYWDKTLTSHDCSFYRYRA